MPVNQTNGTIVGQQAHPSNTDAAVETTIAATAAAIACNQPHSTDQIICDSVDANRQLSFRNLNLKCMCSGEIEPASGEQQALAVDDATADNQISDAQSRTVDDNQQCSHCGRGHCCFFLRCCHCMATEQSEHNKDVGVNVSVTGEDDQSPIVCGNNNVNSKVAVDRNASVRSIASRRCDEICNIRRTALDAGSFCETAKLAEPCSSLSDTKCCDPIDRDAGKCHCRWYCVQECVSDTNETKQCESVERSTSNLQVAPIEIEEKLIRKDASVDDENRLRCCRCSRELFWPNGIAVQMGANHMQSNDGSSNNPLPCIDSEPETNIQDTGATIARTSRKLILDLNDRSKYTKEVSVWLRPCRIACKLNRFLFLSSS